MMCLPARHIWILQLIAGIECVKKSPGEFFKSYHVVFKVAFIFEPQVDILFGQIDNGGSWLQNIIKVMV